VSLFRHHTWTSVYEAWHDTFLGESIVRYSLRYRIDGDTAEESSDDSQGGYWGRLILEQVKILKAHMKQLPDGRWYV
jgi:hypothetical protein